MGKSFISRAYDELLCFLVSSKKTKNTRSAKKLVQSQRKTGCVGVSKYCTYVVHGRAVICGMSSEILAGQ